MKLINKCLKVFSSIQKDKLLHYIVAYLLTELSLTILTILDASRTLNMLITFAVLSNIIIFKEYYDKNNDGTCEMKDIIAGYLGVLTKFVFFCVVTL